MGSGAGYSEREEEGCGEEGNGQLGFVFVSTLHAVGSRKKVLSELTYKQDEGVEEFS